MLLSFFRSFDSPNDIVVSFTLYVSRSRKYSKYEANNIYNKINKLKKPLLCEIYITRVIKFYRQNMMKITKLTLGTSNFNFCRILIDGNCHLAVLNGRIGGHSTPFSRNKMRVWIDHLKLMSHPL
jgi:hypothetical protein